MPLPPTFFPTQTPGPTSSTFQEPPLASQVLVPVHQDPDLDTLLTNDLDDLFEEADGLDDL